MTVVVDSSVLVAALVDHGRNGRWAESWVEGGPLLGPELLLPEASGVLRRLERAGEISAFEATGAHRDLLRLPVRLFPFTPFARRIWALRVNLTTYDAWYVALAEGTGHPLVTMDSALGRAAGARCRIILPPGLRRRP